MPIEVPQVQIVPEPETIPAVPAQETVASAETLSAPEQAQPAVAARVQPVPVLPVVVEPEPAVAPEASQATALADRDTAMDVLLGTVERVLKAGTAEGTLQELRAAVPM